MPQFFATHYFLTALACPILLPYEHYFLTALACPILSPYERYFLTAQACPILQPYEHGNLMKDHRITVGATVKLTCHEGYDRGDGVAATVLECLPQQVWNDSMADCSREFYIL